MAIGDIDSNNFYGGITIYPLKDGSKPYKIRAIKKHTALGQVMEHINLEDGTSVLAYSFQSSQGEAFRDYKFKAIQIFKSEEELSFRPIEGTFNLDDKEREKGGVQIGAYKDILVAKQRNLGQVYAIKGCPWNMKAEGLRCTKCPDGLMSYDPFG